MVAAATNNLCEAANAAVQGHASEEKLISSAKQVAASTAQLLVACKVKADHDSEAMKRLQVSTRLPKAWVGVGCMQVGAPQSSLSLPVCCDWGPDWDAGSRSLGLHCELHARRVSDAGLLSLAVLRDDELVQECLKRVRCITGIREVNVWGPWFVVHFILRGRSTQEVNARALGG